MQPVKPKKHLGQHFLHDKNIAAKITNQLSAHEGYEDLLEIGAGTGVLTRFLLQKPQFKLKVIEIDRESVVYLREQMGLGDGVLYEADFLGYELEKIFSGQFGIIGNFPYNISSQIFFKVIEYRNQIPEVVGMIQKEVAERIAAPHGSKTYGILSVLLQAFYKIEYCFTVNENVFVPPPKVKSAVIRMKRKADFSLPCPERLFFNIVKTAFNQRRKTMRNSLKMLNLTTESYENPVFDKRPEQLSVQDFIDLTNLCDAGKR